MKNKLSTIALVLSAAFAHSAFAANGVWDSTAPWGSATTVEYTEWNSFDSLTSDSTPEVGSGLFASTGGGLLYGVDIYTNSSVPTFTVSLTGTSGLFDVYLRTSTQGNLLSTTATLDGVSATSVQTYSGSSSLGGTEAEVYWVWNNVSVNSTGSYTLSFSAAAPHLLLDQVAVATIAAVPEPSTYGMMGLGLGLLAFAARRRQKDQA